MYSVDAKGLVANLWRKLYAFAAGAIVITLVSSCGGARELNSPQQPKDIRPNRAIDEKRAALTEQCAPMVSKPAADTLPIHITTWGDKGPAVLFIHGGVQGGLGGGPENFAGQKPLFREGWLLKLADRPGFGQSPSRGPDNQEADVLWIAEKLGESSHLIGHSFGGTEALLAAARKPRAVRSLILIEPALDTIILTDFDSLKNPEALSSLRKMGSFFVTAKTPAEFATLFAGSLGQGVSGEPNPSRSALEENPEKAAILGCALLQARQASPGAMRQAADTVARAQIPVLVISGGYSPAQENKAKIVAKLTRGKHVVVPSPNHFVQQTNPKEFNRVVNEFMSRADRR